MLLTLLSFGVLVAVFYFIYEDKMNRTKMNNDEITDVTLSCSDFCFRSRKEG